MWYQALIDAIRPYSFVRTMNAFFVDKFCPKLDDLKNNIPKIHQSAVDIAELKNIYKSKEGKV